MAPSLITYEEAKEIIGVLPSVAPRPNASNLRVLSEHLENKVQTIPAPQQSPDYGFLGMVQPIAIYALKSNVPWVDWEDPGAHPAAAGTTAEQNNIKTLYDANKAAYDSQQNVHRAINNALIEAIPNAFRKPAGNQMGTRVSVPFSTAFEPNMAFALPMKKQQITNASTRDGIPTSQSKPRGGVHLFHPQQAPIHDRAAH